MRTKITPSYFIPHGGGPWNLMGKQHMINTGEINLKNYLNNLGKKYKKIDAIIMITSHWESKDIGISFVENYNLLYDYYGFPHDTYNINYKVKGDLNISKKVEKLLNINGIKSFRDTKRGLDHGSFIPLMEMFPDIKTPVIQVSISNNLNSRFHYKLGEILSSLKKENILILGSGMSYHNMKGFFSRDIKYRNDSIEFNNFIEENINNKEKLLDWENHIFSKKVHPRSEHLMPLFTIVGSQINGTIERDCKIDNYGKEIVGYKVS